MNMDMFGWYVSSTVATTWGLMTVLGLGGWLLARGDAANPRLVQAAIEGIVVAIEETIANSAPAHVNRLLPLVGSLWIFLAVANLVGLIPGLHSPTRDLSATAALAATVFCSTHWFGIRENGLRPYLKHYLSPSPILLPFHLISEITRTVALAIRLFGNIMSLEMGAMLMLLVAGFLVPVPLLLLHVIEGLVQAYIFGMLALIYVASALQHQNKQRMEKNDE
jgi:F-type H+-transporting ATPase subunit a